jgi:hypothetical protein
MVSVAWTVAVPLRFPPMTGQTSHGSRPARTSARDPRSAIGNAPSSRTAPTELASREG